MFNLVAFLVFVYFVCLIICINKIIRQMKLKAQGRVSERQKVIDGLAGHREQLYSEKMDLENDALEIFTLYEITKEITSTFTDRDAFNVFKEKLKQHVDYKDCQFYDSSAKELKEPKEEGTFLMTLKDKNRKFGYLVVEGAAKDDQENITILANQFALALRRVKLYEEIEKIAITDSLTEVYTRRYFLERFKEELERSRVRKIKMSFLMIDVDLFKEVNDEHGHLAGDQILREVGSIIKESIREIDIAGRYGGEEFCVVLPETDKEGAYYAAERIRQQTENTTIKAYDATVKVTLSIGISTFPDDSKTAEELVDKSDWALYRAKKRGRNKVCTFGVIDSKEQ